MKRIFVLVFLCSYGVLAQNNSNIERSIFKVNALAPGVSYELGVGKNLSLNIDALVIPAIQGGSNQETEFGIFPGIQADFRYFTNMKRRLEKGKNITGNSGNYLGLTNLLYSGNSFVGDLNFDSKFNHIAALTYGIQRTRPKGFYWGFSLGPGLYTDDFNTQFTFFVDLRLGWVLKKKK